MIPEEKKCANSVVNEIFFARLSKIQIAFAEKNVTVIIIMICNDNCASVHAHEMLTQTQISTSAAQAHFSACHNLH